MFARLLAGGALVTIATPAMAQSHDHHAVPAPAPAPAPAPIDHSQMDHSAMEHDMAGQGSGTARLPRNDAMDHGAMIGLGATPA